MLANWEGRCQCEDPEIACAFEFPSNERRKRSAQGVAETGRPSDPADGLAFDPAFGSVHEAHPKVVAFGSEHDPVGAFPGLGSLLGPGIGAFPQGHMIIENDGRLPFVKGAPVKEQRGPGENKRQGAQGSHGAEEPLGLGRALTPAQQPGAEEKQLEEQHQPCQDRFGHPPDERCDEFRVFVEGRFAFGFCPGFGEGGLHQRQGLGCVGVAGAEPEASLKVENGAPGFAALGVQQPAVVGDIGVRDAGGFEAFIPLQRRSGVSSDAGALGFGKKLLQRLGGGGQGGETADEHRQKLECTDHDGSWGRRENRVSKAWLRSRQRCISSGVAPAEEKRAKSQLSSSSTMRLQRSGSRPWA